MKKSINWQSGIPLWIQVKEIIRRRILAGEFRPGDQLPTVRQLAVELRINYNTVNRAYMDLEQENYIVSRRGKGTFVVESVSDNLTQVREAEQAVDAFVRRMMGLGISPDLLLDMIHNRLESIRDEKSRQRE